MHIFVFSPEYSLNYSYSYSFDFVRIKFRKITGGPVYMGSGQTFAYIFYAHRSPQGRQLVWKVVWATSTKACVQPCRPRLTKSLDNKKHVGCMMHKTLGKNKHFGCMTHKILENPAVCDGSPCCSDLLDGYSPLAHKEVWGRIVKKKPTDMCLRAAKRGER